MHVADLIKRPEILRSNILSVYESATKREIKDGRLWYPNARAFCLSLAEKHDTTPIIATGVTSGLSVMKSWEENQKIADLYFYGIQKHTLTQYSKCKNIERDGTYVGTINILGGKKTQNFFRAMLDPSDRNATTIDRHAISVALGQIETTCTDKTYEIIKQAYMDVARDLGLLSNELQAITWIVHRRVKKEHSKPD